MRNFLIALLVFWVVAFFGSFIAFYVTPSQDLGFTAGWNKLGVFITWQGVATGLAVLCLFLRWTTSDARLRRWAAMPAIGIGILVLGLGGLLLWANLQHSAAVGGAPSVTQPVTVAPDTGN
ncbi:hypothetical protein AIOL_004825 [Candidatus Rhodobacter oscarellae]|uniref:Uncharacterized protein n=1 Tax=Candidatus Rhodobacter oscarellae TaxID=1675527 RepID=A0A0J9EB32_9RHOB|nr:hypothetical protein [Candidatus Rhodobacter lobularis]KMW59841.1 hypothetical protein AIOL_004825 [Candidatus Rhodobacter lobularis]